MVILDLGKARESTMVPAEAHKEAVRRYMEARGWGLRFDSRADAHPTDQVYRRADGTPGPEAWAESKATDLAFSDSALKDEMRRYAHEWARRSQETRFEFYLFAKSLKKRSAWDEVFSPKALLETIKAWLGEKDLPPDDDLLAFFVHATVVVGDATHLDDATSAYRKERTQAGQMRADAKKRLQVLESHADPPSRRSTLVGNLLEFSPPSTLRTLDVQAIPDEDLHRRLRLVDRPPYAVLERGQILTLDIPQVEDMFEPVDAHNPRTIPFERAAAQHPGRVLRLLNDAWGDYCWPHGVGFHKGRYYFLAEREFADRADRRNINSENGPIMVVKLVYPKELEEELRVTEGVHHIWHDGFTLRTRHLWGQWFIHLTQHRLFSEDGRSILEGDRAAALDQLYRRPEYNRSDAHLRKLTHLANHFFLKANRSLWPSWGREFRFVGLQTLETMWTPERYDPHASRLSDFFQEVPP